MALNTYTAAIADGGSSSGMSSVVTSIMHSANFPLSDIEGIPYQFLASVDPRSSIGNTYGIGRKYAEKIMSRLPLLILVPCEPKFLDDFKSDSKEVLGSILANQQETDVFSAGGRYYSTQYAYANYYDYLNPMLWSVVHYLGIGGTSYKGQGLGSFNWATEYSSDLYKQRFSSSEGVGFYLDGMDTVGESFSNGTTQSVFSSLFSSIDEYSRELNFLLGSGEAGGLAGKLYNTLKGGSEEEKSSGLFSGLSSFGEKLTNGAQNILSGGATALGGKLVGSLLGEGVNTVVNGGKIVFPDLWSDSSYDKSYSLNFKFRSPDHDSVSIFLNVIKPYCKLLALTLPHTVINAGNNENANAYRAPFLVQAYCKGMFNIRMGIITGMSVTKGATCCWNDDGLPTQIDVSIDIADLYHSLAMSGMNKSPFLGGGFLGSAAATQNIAKNVTYQDFLANTSGVNVFAADGDLTRATALMMDLAGSSLYNAPKHAAIEISQGVSQFFNRVHNIFN